MPDSTLSDKSLNNTPRKRGAPKGNRNAVKHGFYSRLHPSEKSASLPTPADQLQPDIAIFRGLIFRVNAALSSADMPPSTFADDLALLHLVCIAVARLNSFWRTNKRLTVDGIKPLLAVFESFGFVSEQVDPAIFVAPRRGQGGQSGNRNAFKSGVYASPLSPAERQRVEAPENASLESELNLLRILLLRTASSMRNAQGISSALHLRAFRVVTLAVTLIEKLERRKSPSFSAPYRLDELLGRLARAESQSLGMNCSSPRSSETIPPSSS